MKDGEQGAAGTARKSLLGAGEDGLQGVRRRKSGFFLGRWQGHHWEGTQEKKQILGKG